MSGATLTVETLAWAGAQLAGAGHGGKTATAQRLAGLFGTSVATLYRQLAKAGLTNGPERKREPVKPEYRDWTRTIMALASKTPEGHPAAALWMAKEQAVRDNLVPAEATQVPVETLHRIARELGFRQTETRTRRLWCRHPMQVVLFDASTSNYFSVIKSLGDGDYLLKLQTRVHQVYKNKPLAKERLRLLVYGVWDMRTGYQLSRYVAATGENGADAMEFLCWAFGEKDDPRIPFQGVPEQLWADQGPVTKLGASLDLIERLGIELVKGDPYSKERMGGVERTHRTRWSFERHFFMYLEEGGKVELKLSDLNAMLLTYLAEHANKQPARYATLSRTKAWVAGVTQMGGVRKLPAHAMETMATQIRRKVGKDGTFVLAGKDYEVERLYNAEVYVNLDQERVVQTVRAIDTGKLYPVRELKQVMVGENYKGIHKTDYERLREQAAGLAANQTLFQSGAGEESPVLLRLPPRLAPAAPLANPLDASCYDTLQEAMAAFFEIYGPLDTSLRGKVEELIQNNKRDRNFVRELALGLINATRERMAVNE